VGIIPTAPKVKLTTNAQNRVLNTLKLKYEIKGISCQSICNISERTDVTDTASY
jgi:hypothetical protein